MRFVYFATLLAGLLFSGQTDAQNFGNTIFFGDSNSDSGRYLYLNNPGPGGSPSSPPGTGAYTTNPGPEWSVALGSKFGITVTPSDAPGGGNNYAAGGARVSTTNANEWSATDQVNAYLSSVGNVADPHALYTMWIGVNDLKGSSVPDIIGNNSAIVALAGQTAGLISQLYGAGARYFLVPNAPAYTMQGSAAAGFSFDQTTFDSRTLYSQTVWNDIAAKGINFIPADFSYLLNYVITNPSQFGILVTSVTTAACGSKNSYQCGPSDLATPNANLTYFFADGTSAPDGGGHVTTAVQQIEADYAYSLITAPSEISFLAETAVKARLGLVSSIQNQIELSDSHRGPSGVNAWITGDVTSLSIDNYHGFPGDPDTVISGAVGVDYAFAPGLIAGFTFSGGTLTSALGTYGSFTQDETSASLYAAYKAGPLWANAIGTYGHLDYNVNRNVPIGISIQNNTGATSGGNWSAALQGGYKFWTDSFTHGPVLGYVHQNVNVGAFTESGSFTSLGFGSQNRDSDVGQFGYRVSYNWADIQPFVQASWDHEFANTNRNVTASLTTVVAPSYSLPAVVLGKDWGEVKGGVIVDAGQGVKAFVVGTADFGEKSATVYGGQLGFNIAF
jgi:outer membrane lipase/esterase